MIESIVNSAKVQPGLIELKPSPGFKSMPAVNSTVLVNVLEKVGVNYRLLISGSVYQSNLPVATEKGEEFLAKVMSQSPLTLGLDNFAKLGQLDNQSASLLLAKLKIADTALSKSLVEKVVSFKKPLLKSKINRLIDFVENMDIKIDDVQMQLLISIIWNLSDDKLKDAKNVFENIFDVSFEELSKKIFSLVERSNSLNLSQEFYDLLNDKIILDSSALVLQPKISSVKDKSEDFINVVHFIDENRSSYNHDKAVIGLLDEMKIYLLKYVIQKSFYGKFNIYPEFVIVKRDHCLELINYRIEKNDNSSFKLTSKIDYWNNESLILQGLYANDKFIGEAIANNKIQKIVNNHLAGLNNKIAKAVRIVSDVKSTIKSIATTFKGDSIVTHRPINMNV